MGFYANKRTLRDGRILLFQRSDTKGAIWQMRLRVPGIKGYVPLSTKTSDEYEARQIAEDKFYELRKRAEVGLPTKTKTFREYWHYWFERECATGTWKDDRVRWHKSMFNRYFDAYFGKYELSEIKGEVAKGYWAWRIGYWKEGGAGYSQRKQHPNAQEAPSAKTLRMERSALKQIFTDAHQNGLIRVVPPLDVPTKFRKSDNRRPTFTTNEWRTLVSNFDNWCDAKGRFADNKGNSFHHKQRWLLRHYVYFLSNTGMRVGEVRQMRWEDVTEFTDAEDGETKLEIRVRADTKQGKMRTVISQPNAVKLLNAVREISDYTKPQDFVFAGKDGKERTDFNKTFTKLLKLIPYKDRPEGLLRDADGDKRTLYSLRHFYASQRQEKGDVPLALLAQNMGTSIMQLQKHYLHLDVKRQSGTITRMTKKKLSTSERDRAMKAILQLVEEGGEEEAVAMLRGLAAGVRKPKKRS